MYQSMKSKNRRLSMTLLGNISDSRPPYYGTLIITDVDRTELVVKVTASLYWRAVGVSATEAAQHSLCNGCSAELPLLVSEEFTR